MLSLTLGPRFLWFSKGQVDGNSENALCWLGWVPASLLGHDGHQPGLSEISHENRRNARDGFCLGTSFLCLRSSIFGFHESVPLMGHARSFFFFIFNVFFRSLFNICIHLPFHLVTRSLEEKMTQLSSAADAITQRGCRQTASRVLGTGPRDHRILDPTSGKPRLRETLRDCV